MKVISAISQLNVKVCNLKDRWCAVAMQLDVQVHAILHLGFT